MDDAHRRSKVTINVHWMCRSLSTSLSKHPGLISPSHPPALLFILPPYENIASPLVHIKTTRKATRSESTKRLPLILFIPKHQPFRMLALLLFICLDSLHFIQNRVHPLLQQNPKASRGRRGTYEPAFPAELGGGARHAAISVQVLFGLCFGCGILICRTEPGIRKDYGHNDRQRREVEPLLDPIYCFPPV